MAKTCQLFSGSSGNSIYVSTPSGGILVDIGVSARKCENALKDIDINPETLQGIFITHEHTDHVKGLRVFTKKYNIPVYAKEDVITALYKDNTINNDININIMPEELDIDNVEVSTLLNSHDSVSCIGYKFKLPDGRKIAVCTDTGYVTDSAKSALKDVDLIYLESNYDQSMLEAGRYPYELKRRIMSKMGHLSNSDSNDFSVELLQSGTTYFVLSHLSQENNTRDVAAQSFISRMLDIDAKLQKDYRLFVSAPNGNGGIIEL